MKNSRTLYLVAILGMLLSVCCSSVRAEKTKRYDLNHHRLQAGGLLGD